MSILPVVFRGLVVIALLVLATLLLGDVLDRHWIDVYVRNHGVAGEALFVLVTGLLMSVGMSRQVVAFLAGYGFGFTPGLLLAMLAAVAACIYSFYVVRLLLRKLLMRRFTQGIRKVDAFIHDNTFAMTLIIRLLPIGNNLMVNMAAGASGVRALPFFFGSALGYIPQMVIFALVGSGSQLQEFWQVAIAMAMFIVAAALSGWLLGRYRQQQGPGAAG